MHIRLEYIISFVVFIVIPLIIKRTFYSNFSISEFIGLSRSIILIIVFASMAMVFWLVRMRIKDSIERILYGLDGRIIPLVWLFAILLILSVPLSMLKNVAFGTKRIQDDKLQAANIGQQHPNIIVIIMDSLYSGDMQIYGYERKTTPFILEWAKDAVVFNKAYASSNYTTAATMSLLTGQRVWTHKVWYAAVNNPVGNYEKSLPKVLKDYGYDIYGFIQNDNAHPNALGLQDAFLVKDDYLTFLIPNGWWFDKVKSFFSDRPIVNALLFQNALVIEYISSSRPDMYTTDAPSELVYDRFLDRISKSERRESHRPFFAYLHVMPPHYFYLPPKPYMGLFGDSTRFESMQSQWSNFKFNSEYKPDKQNDINILRKRYDEFILYSDTEFEHLLSRLEKVVDMSNTIIILSSDHGESFSHGFLAHGGPHLYESLTHIPLIIKIPWQTNNIKIDMPVAQIDIAPTILELAGIHTPDWMEGRSLVPLVKEEQMESSPLFAMYLQKNRSFGQPITKGTIAVWDRDYKLIYYLEDNKKLLFNLKTDPDETKNIIFEELEISKHLLKLINNNLSLANARITKRY